MESTALRVLNLDEGLYIDRDALLPHHHVDL